MNVILDATQFRRLEGLRLNPRKSFGGRVRGERLTRKKGVSIEFADFREYSEGDDLRHLDWNVLARLDTPVMRTYQDEEDLALHLLVDVSPSMSFGEPTKADYARQIAALFAYVALNGGDAVIPKALGLREPNHRPLRGRANYPDLCRWLDAPRDVSLRPTGLAPALREFAASSARTGMVLILSDGMDPEVAAAIRTLAGKGHEVLFLQILSEVELSPDLEGDLRLVDAEGGQTVEITANGSVLREYQRRLEAHNRALSDGLVRVGGRHQLLSTSTAWESALETLRRAGWLASGSGK